MLFDIVFDAIEWIFEIQKEVNNGFEVLFDAIEWIPRNSWEADQNDAIGN